MIFPVMKFVQFLGIPENAVSFTVEIVWNTA